MHRALIVYRYPQQMLRPVPPLSETKLVDACFFATCWFYMISTRWVFLIKCSSSRWLSSGGTITCSDDTAITPRGKGSSLTMVDSGVTAAAVAVAAAGIEAIEICRDSFCCVAIVASSVYGKWLCILLWALSSPSSVGHTTWRWVWCSTLLSSSSSKNERGKTRSGFHPAWQLLIAHRIRWQIRRKNLCSKRRKAVRYLTGN